METSQELNSLGVDRAALANQVELSKFIDNFLKNIEGISGCLVTEDGLIIAKSSKYYESNADELGVITASMLSVAERAVFSIKNNQTLKKILIETSVPEDEAPSCIINVIQVAQNVLFAFNHSSTVENGLVVFELNQVLKQIKSIFENNRTQILEHIGTMI